MRQDKGKNPEQPSFETLLFSPPEAAEKLPSAPLPVEADQELASATLPLYRVELVREGQQTASKRPRIKDPKDAATIFSEFLKDKDREHFVALLLDTKNRVIGLHVVSIGILDSALVHPREVFKAAVLASAANIIVAHNHPSGDPTPSQEDKVISKRLFDAGKILGIEVLDHIIVGEGGEFCSLQQLGVL